VGTYLGPLHLLLLLLLVVLLLLLHHDVLPPSAALRIACSAHSSRSTVEYVIYKLSKRLSNPSWVVVLKALMTFHRLLRECDSTFQDQVGQSHRPTAHPPLPPGSYQHSAWHCSSSMEGCVAGFIRGLLTDWHLKGTSGHLISNSLVSRAPTPHTRGVGGLCCSLLFYFCLHLGH